VSRQEPTGYPAKMEEHLISLISPTSFGAEQYRGLRHQVEQLRVTSNLSVIGVTSPEAADGKTLTAINLAGALAQATEARVLIIDADLRLSSMAEYLGLEGSSSRGLVGAILDQGSPLQTVVEPCPPFNLSVVRAGRRTTTPYELLKSPRLGQLLDEARRDYDYVIVDMPPLLPLLDCRVLGQWVDGFFVVVGAHKTPRKLVGEALKLLDPATIIGLIFNGDDGKPGGYYGARASSGAERSRWFGGRRGRRASSSEGSE
jgi:capsular exopolysaccharide synthesis family protein